MNKISKIMSMTLAIMSITNLSACTENDNSSVPTKISGNSSYITENSSQTESEGSENNSEEPSKNEELYDTTAISQAYLKNDTSKLDDFQLTIYNEAVKCIELCITPDMTDYEKELAVHDYIILKTEYDDVHLSAISDCSENAENPYGALINGKSICSGYTTTFQLIMDMLEIPCISISAKDKFNEDHAWNMVEIQGEWYYIDVTWDDPVPDCENRPVHHKYFNVTEEYMKIKHRWDSSDLPSADSYENSHIQRNICEITGYEQVEEIMQSALENMNDSVYFSFEDMGISFSKYEKPDSYISARKISDEFEEVIESFRENHTEYSISCQRVKCGDKIVLAVYMTKF